MYLSVAIEIRSEIRVYAKFDEKKIADGQMLVSQNFLFCTTKNWNSSTAIKTVANNVGVHHLCICDL